MCPDVLPAFLSKEAETSWLIELKETYWKHIRLPGPAGDWRGTGRCASQQEARSMLTVTPSSLDCVVRSQSPVTTVSCPDVTHTMKSWRGTWLVCFTSQVFVPTSELHTVSSSQDHSSSERLTARSKCQGKERDMLALLLIHKLCSCHQFYPIHREQDITFILA